MNSLFLRIFLWFCGATAAIVTIVIAGFVADSPGALATNWRDLGQNALVAAGRTAIESYERGGEPELSGYLGLLATQMSLQAALLDGSGRELTGRRPVPEGVDPEAFRPLGEGELSVRGRDGLAGVALRSASGTRYLFVAYLRPRGRDRWARTFLFLLVLAGCVLCYGVARHVTSPVVRLRAATAQFSRGDLRARVTAEAVLKRQDEIGALARDFNEMADRIEGLVKAQQRLMADVSHELRSPLTRLGLALGLVRRRREADLATPLARMEREVERLNLLIGQLLTLSRLESLNQPPPMERFELSALVREVAADADFEASSGNRSVRLLDGTACSVQGARDLLRSALENVIRNAVKYTAPDTTVEVRVVHPSGSRTATIVVEDHGPGVPESELTRVFEPFYRVDEARQRDTGGAGLGLAITRRIAALHGGTAEAANHPSGGLEIRITLPVDDAV